MLMKNSLKFCNLLRFSFCAVLWMAVFNSCSSAQAQNFARKTVPQHLISKSFQPNYSVQKTGFYQMPAALLTGKDHTAVVQKTIHQNKNIILPDAVLYINKNGLFIPSDRIVIFQKNTRIEYLGGASGKLSDVIKIYDSKNVELYNPVVVGSRHRNVQQNGQWNAGICILNSTNVMIFQPKITDSFGDGIMIGSENGGFSSSVKVLGGWIDNARRNGISVTSGRNITVENVLISNTNGHDPEAGIDVEASWEKDILENITLRNITTFNNGSAGIAVNLNGLSTEDPTKRKSSSIVIDRHYDLGSRHGILTSLNTLKNRYDTAGTLSIKNAKWEESRESVYWKSAQEHTVKVIFENIEIQDRQKKSDFQRAVQTSQNIEYRSL